ncbi:hypothetical protein [Streptomyces omiyaensis]|uniref:Uncharacterized protein n=1 Tax=Streptomyces omiyaensis TaxID=68247 RepID=A0ABW7C3Q5_9ACTN
MVTQWQQRKAVGDAHEQRVAAALAAQGWTVERCGQGTYPPAIQQALARTTSALRWFPDLIAARAGEVVFRGGGPSDRRQRMDLSERRAAALAQWAAHPTATHKVVTEAGRAHTALANARANC